MSTRKIQFLMSIAFVAGYFVLLGMIIYIEASDSINMKKGDNSMMGELKILLGIMTGAVAQILNFWFNKVDRSDEPNTFPSQPANLEPVKLQPTEAPIPVPVVSTEEG